ncbi:MAG: hypothetical protein ACPGO3_13295 [Magnetospiraceae bacterium]
MSDFVGFSQYRLTLQAGETVTIHASGRFLRCTEGSAFTLSLDHGPAIPWAKGLSVSLEGVFSNLVITNTSGAVNTIQIYTGWGAMTDDRALLDNNAVNVNITQTSSPGGLVAVADVALVADTATQVIAALSTRNEVIVSNVGAAAVRIGHDNTVGAAKGFLLGAGETVGLQTGSAIWAYSPGAAGTLALAYTEWA